MPISENQIVVPALIAMYNSGNHEIQTSALITYISRLFTLDAHDLAPLAGRNDENYTQIVRNLKSHKTLRDLGYAVEIVGGFRLTPAGIAWLTANGLIAP